MTTTHDPDRYRELSTPFHGDTAANDALREFFDAVEAARVKYNIADVSVIVQVSIQNGESGPVRHGMASAYYGDPLAHKLALLARCYGEAKQEHEAVLGDLIEAGRRSVRERLR